MDQDILLEKKLEQLYELIDGIETAMFTTRRPGGRLVYSVCTLTREETLGVDQWAEQHLPELAARPPPPAPWRPHGRGALLLPSAANTDGMFVLVLERRLYPPDR